MKTNQPLIHSHVGESRDRVLMEARPRGTDWMTPQSKTISSDEKQIGVAGAGKGGGRMARAQGKFWGAGHALYLHYGDRHAGTSTGICQNSSICTLQTGSFCFV